MFHATNRKTATRRAALAADLTSGAVPAGTSLYAKWTRNPYTVTCTDVWDVKPVAPAPAGRPSPSTGVR